MNRWDDHYRSGFTPWDTTDADAHLVQAVRAGRLPAGRALDVGCGTGTHARFLAASGWDVVGVDLAPTALVQAREQAGGVRYLEHDVLAAALPEGPYDLVFDRGCFHTFDEDEQRALFAERVAAALRTGGIWLCLSGSTEGAPRDTGPPRRSARDLVRAIEPALEIVALEGGSFAEGPLGNSGELPTSWTCFARKRALPAQPSSRHPA